jgi:hypothetical protein
MRAMYQRKNVPVVGNFEIFSLSRRDRWWVTP